MDKLVLLKDFPSPRPGEKLEEYMPKYTRWLTKEIFGRFAFAINFLLSISNDNILEIIKEGNVPGGDGNWKIDISTGDFVIAERVSGAWVDAWKLSSSA